MNICKFFIIFVLWMYLYLFSICGGGNLDFVSKWSLIVVFILAVSSGPYPKLIASASLYIMYFVKIHLSGRHNGLFSIVSKSLVLSFILGTSPVYLILVESHGCIRWTLHTWNFSLWRFLYSFFHPFVVENSPWSLVFKYIFLNPALFPISKWPFFTSVLMYEDNYFGFEILRSRGSRNVCTIFLPKSIFNFSYVYNFELLWF